MSSRIARGLTVIILLCVHIASAPAQQEGPKLDLKILNHIPSDTVLAIVVPGADRTSRAVKEMVLDVAGPAGAMLGGEQFDPMGLFLQNLPLGKGLDRSGSAGYLLLDPEKYSSSWIRQRPEDAPQVRMDEALENYPWVGLLPVSDPETLFDTEKIQVEKQGEFYRIANQVWGKVCSKHMVIASKKETLMAFPTAVNLMTRMTPEHEKMIVRDHLWIFADWKRLGQLRRKDLLPDVFSGMGFSPFGGPRVLTYIMSGITPAIYPMGWVYLTRGENLSEATMMAAGLSFTGEAIRIEARWTYPEDSHMARALGDFKKPEHPLIRNLPNSPGVFVYGADKSFHSPAALKEKQYRKLADWLKNTPVFAGQEDQKQLDKFAAQLVDVVSTLQEQVLSVEHCFDVDYTNDRAIQFGTVAKVKDSAVVLQSAGKIVERLNTAFGGHPFMPIRLLSRQRPDLGREGVSVYEFAATEENKNQPVELPKEATKVLGDKYFRIYVASVGKDTIVTSLGGDEAFLEKMIQVAKAQDTFQMPESWKKTRDMLPENRAVEFYISPARVLEMVKFAVGQMDPAQMETVPAFPSHTPLAAAVAVEKNDMSIVGVVPYDIPKSIILMQMKMSQMGPQGP